MALRTTVWKRCVWFSHLKDSLTLVGFAGDEKTNFALELTYNYGKDGPGAYNIGRHIPILSRCLKMLSIFLRWVAAFFVCLWFVRLLNELLRYSCLQTKLGQKHSFRKIFTIVKMLAGSGFGHFALAVPDVYELADKVKKNGSWSLTPCTNSLKRYPTFWSNRMLDNFEASVYLKVLHIVSHCQVVTCQWFGVSDYSCLPGILLQKSHPVPSIDLSLALTLHTGGTVSREPGPVKGGTTEIAFIKDPTGYSWEIIQRKDQKIREPIAQVIQLSKPLAPKLIAWWQANTQQLMPLALQSRMSLGCGLIAWSMIVGINHQRLATLFKVIT